MSQWRVGDPRLPERFWRKVRVNASTGCWEWIGTLNSRGYSLLRIGSTTRRGHRLSYEALVAAIPEGLVLDHLCRVRHCVNPSHLEAVTQGINTARSPIAVSTMNAAKTHCPRGHEYDEANTRVYRKKRYCRTCVNEYSRERRRRAAIGLSSASHVHVSMPGVGR